jgi:hypothetical protein
MKQPQPRYRLSHVTTALALALSAVPAAADDAAVAAVLDQAMNEWRVILTCSSLIPDDGGRLLGFWQDDVAETLSVIAAAGAQPDNLASFTASALPGSLLPAPDTPWGEVVAFCQADPDWYTRFQRFDIVILPRDVEEALAAP